MKILWICFVWPEPRATAAGFHTRQRIDALREAGHHVTITSPCRSNEHEAALRDDGYATARLVPNDVAFDAFVTALMPDVVVFDRFMIEEQFSWRVKAACPAAVRVLDTIDLHSVRRARQARCEGNDSIAALPLSDAELHNDDAIRELAAIYRSDLSLIISDPEMSFLRARYHVPKAQLSLCRFAYPPPPPSRAYAARKHFVTIGNFSHAPNADSVRVLANGLWTRVVEALRGRGVHDAELHVYGAYLPQDLSALPRAPGMIVKGRAPDARETLEQYRVNLAPLRFGAGIKGKVADGWSAGTPCVATSIAAEGMHDGLPFGGTVAASWEDFAVAAAQLYCDEKQWHAAQHNGAAILRAQFDAPSNTTAFVADIENIARHGAAQRAQNFVGAMLWHQQHRATEYFSRWIEAKDNLRALTQTRT